MSRLIIDSERCKSCGYCVHFCPTQALSFSSSLNSNSYNYVKVDEEKCVVCGTCYNVCTDMVFTITDD